MIYSSHRPTSRPRANATHSSITLILHPPFLRSTPPLLQIRILDRPRLRHGVRQGATLVTGPVLLGSHEGLNGGLDLGAKIGAVEGGLVDDSAAAVFLAVPPHAVDGVLGAALLDDDAHRVGEAHGVVRRVARQQKHVALPDHHVPERALVYHLQDHRPFVLVEPLRRLVDVVVCPGVGTAYDLVGKDGVSGCGLFPPLPLPKEGGRWKSWFIVNIGRIR